MTVVKIRGKDTDVSRSDCGRRECFSLGHDQGPYVQGRGYTGSGSGQALCQTRHLRGCPSNSLCTKCRTLSVLHVTELDGACDRRGCDGKRVDAAGNPAPPPSSSPKPLVFALRREYVEAFRRGEKRLEFRTRPPKVEAGELVLIYETAPQRADGWAPSSQMIVAVAKVGEVHVGTPDEIWDLAGAKGGIERWRFDRYFSKLEDGKMVPRARAVAIELEPTWLTCPRPLWPSMSPPQSWSRWQGPWPMPSWGMSAGAGG